MNFTLKSQEMAIPDFENQNFPGGACPRTPLAYASLRAWLVKFPQLRHWIVPLENGNHFTDFSTNENGLGCIQNQSLVRCKQISQFIAHENGFGSVQNQSLDRC
jgi:hypothetical protein